MRSRSKYARHFQALVALIPLSLPYQAHAQAKAAAPKADRNSSVTALSKGKTFVRKGVSRQQFAAFEFPTWQPDSLHWTAPSSLYVATNGDWFFYAEALENQRGNMSGRPYVFQLKITYYRDYDAVNKRCAGPAVHGATYLTLRLNWKQKVTKYSLNGHDNRIPGIVGGSQCATADRIMSPA